VVTIAAVRPAEVQITFRLTNDTGTTVTVTPTQLTLDAVPAKSIEPATPVLTGETQEETATFTAATAGTLVLPGGAEVAVS